MGYGDLSPKQYGDLSSADYEKEALSDRVPHGEKPLMIMLDNKGAIAISKNPVLHKRSKHIHINFHIVRQEVNRGHVRMEYIDTKENLADLLTKCTTRQVHYYLSGALLHSRIGGRIFDFKGKAEVASRTSRDEKDKLYLSQPRGLLDEDMLLVGRPRGAEAASAERRRREKFQELSGLLQGAEWRKCCAEIFKMARRLARRHGAVAAGEWASVGMYKQLIMDAIVDSGASYTYVTDDVELEHPRAGEGCVSVANGRLEKVIEIGDLGPIHNTRKVSSFTRTLVSVRDLVDLCGAVRFDKEGVHVVSNNVSSKVGTALPSRLYSFDLKNLCRHVHGSRSRTIASAA